jgi:hypothetical protein
VLTVTRSSKPSESHHTSQAARSFPLESVQGVKSRRLCVIMVALSVSQNADRMLVPCRTRSIRRRTSSVRRLALKITQRDPNVCPQMTIEACDTCGWSRATFCRSHGVPEARTSCNPLRDLHIPHFVHNQALRDRESGA